MLVIQHWCRLYLHVLFYYFISVLFLYATEEFWKYAGKTEYTTES